MIIELIYTASTVVSYIGAMIIIYGGILALFNTLKQELKGASEIVYIDIRRDFTHKILFGLDFLIASDILKTISAPNEKDLVLLASIVGIRTVMGYFFTKEAIELELRELNLNNSLHKKIK